MTSTVTFNLQTCFDWQIQLSIARFTKNEGLQFGVQVHHNCTLKFDDDEA